MTAILFLDVDGPMIPRRAGFFLKENQKSSAWGWQFDPIAVGFLNFLAWAVPNLQVVVASHRVGMRNPWCGRMKEFDRVSMTRESWEIIFAKNDLKVQLHDDWITIRKAEARTKYEEIDDWLRLHPEIKMWCTIEDEPCGYNNAAVTNHVSSHVRNRLNLCAEDSLDGITFREMLKIAKHFGIERQDFFDKYDTYTLVVNTVREEVPS